MKVVHQEPVVVARSQQTLMIAAYAVISVALVDFTLFHVHLPPLRFYPVILLLSLLLVLNAVWNGLQQRLGELAANQLFFSLSTVIFLIVNYLGLDEGWTFLPFLLFVIASQAVVGLGIRYGLGLSGLLLLSWSGVL